MKCTAIIFAVLVVMAATLANFALATAPKDQQQEPAVALASSASLNTLFDELPEETHHVALENYRVKRATCDLTSGTGVGSSLCAVHCIAKRYRGGYCNGKRVCVCRR
uniref:INVERT_DEFENSINS domain-containing protein n=1 Tax=Anopheles atroparvus TaxID=41427 RepID=A0A182JEU8_ANOAO